MKFKSIFLIIFTAVTLVPVSAQTTQKLTANKLREYGLEYVLPQTRLNVTLAARKTVSEPGEFALYAKKYLHIDQILKPSTSWELADAELQIDAVADDSERWLVQFKSGSTPFIIVTEQGFPVCVNDESYNPDPVAPPTLRSVAAEPTALELPAAREAMTEEMLRSNSSAKRAELAAARIYEIRQQRSDIISGQADAMPADGQAMKLVLDALSQQEAALTAMFAGTKKTSTEVITVSVDPPMGDDATRFVVARLSATDGLVGADDLSGQPIYIEFTDIATSELPVNEKGETKTFPKGGLAYRIPGEATAIVSFDGRELAKERFSVAQYGVVFGLEPALFTDKKAPAYLRFNPLSGSVRELGTLAQ